MGITLIHTSDCVLLSRNDPICVNYPGGSGVCNMRNISLWNWNLQCNTYFQSQQRVTHLESFVLTKIIKYSVLCSIWSIRHSNVVFAPIAMFYVAFLHRGMYAGHGKVLDYVVSSNTSEICPVRRQQGIQIGGVYPHTHSQNPSKCCWNIQGERAWENAATANSLWLKCEVMKPSEWDLLLHTLRPLGSRDVFVDYLCSSNIFLLRYYSNAKHCLWK